MGMNQRIWCNEIISSTTLPLPNHLVPHVKVVSGSKSLWRSIYLSRYQTTPSQHKTEVPTHSTCTCVSVRMCFPVLYVKPWTRAHRGNGKHIGGEASKGEAGCLAKTNTSPARDECKHTNMSKGTQSGGQHRPNTKRRYQPIPLCMCVSVHKCFPVLYVKPWARAHRGNGKHTGGEASKGEARCVEKANTSLARDEWKHTDMIKGTQVGERPTRGEASSICINPSKGSAYAPCA